MNASRIRPGWLASANSAHTRLRYRERSAGETAGVVMPSQETLQSLPEGVLWEFLKWLAFSQGRYVGIRIEPRPTDSHNRLQQLAENVFLAPKRPDDAALGVTLPAVADVEGGAGLVAAVAEYVAMRHIALCRNAADFEPRDAFELQEDALRRIKKRFGCPTQEAPN